MDYYKFSLCLQWFTVEVCLLILSTSVPYNAGKTWLKSPQEAWILIGSHKYINCTRKGNAPTHIAMHWERNGKKINQSGNRFLKEVKLHDNIIQLQFLNAKSTDAGIYHCLAQNEDGEILNSTSYVHVGRLPRYMGYNCTYDHYRNRIWIFPLIEEVTQNTHLKVKYCLSRLMNSFCTRNAKWYNATCTMEKMSCSAFLKRNSKYVLQIVLHNKYGSSINKPVIGYPERSCGDLSPEIQGISLEDGNHFRINWKLPPVSSFATISIFDYLTAERVYKISVKRKGPKTEPGGTPNFTSFQTEVLGKKGTLKIDKALRECTKYKICIGLLKTERCYYESTKNGYIPKMKNVKFSDNIVKKILEFYWTDPVANTETSSRVFFYEYKVFQESNRTIHASVNNTKLFIPRPKAARVVFTVKRCTPCGCGEDISKAFPLSSLEPSSKRSEEAIVKIRGPLIAGVVSGSVFLLLIAILFLIRRIQSRNSASPETNDDRYEDVPHVLHPLEEQHDYDVCDPEEMYDKVEHYSLHDESHDMHDESHDNNSL